MDALILLIPLSVLALGIAGWLFLRMSAGGQFEDGEGPAFGILLDDDRAVPQARDDAAAPDPAEGDDADGAQPVGERAGDHADERAGERDGSSPR